MKAADTCQSSINRLRAESSILSKQPNNRKASAALVGAEDIETLMSLGLTGRQARVYLALLKIGDNKANAVAKLSQVNRQEIYRVLDSLQEIGLVQRKVTSPTTFTPTPVNEALKMLLEKKASELRITRQKTRGVIKKFDKLQSNKTKGEDTCCLGVISENDRGKKYKNALDSVQESLECITTWNRFRQTILFEAQIEKTLKRATNTRVVMEKPSNQPLPKWITKAATKLPSSFEVKTLSTQPATALTIFDNTTVCIALNINADLKRGPHLWSSNPSIIALAKTYFENTWKQAKNADMTKLR